MQRLRLNSEAHSVVGWVVAAVVVVVVAAVSCRKLGAVGEVDKLELEAVVDGKLDKRLLGSHKRFDSSAEVASDVHTVVVDAQADHCC